MLRRPTGPPGPRFSHATGDARHGLDEFNPFLFRLDPCFLILDLPRLAGVALCFHV